MSKKTILLIDGCNLLHQSFHKFENLSLLMETKWSNIRIFRSLHGFLYRWDPDEVIITLIMDTLLIEMLCYQIIRDIGKYFSRL